MRRYVVPLLVLALAAPLSARTPEETAAAALKAAPVWDGHNDVAEQLRTRRRDVIADFNFNDTTHEPDGKGGTKTMHTDLPRLAKGQVGAQFWSVYVSANLPEPEAVVATMEQIDVIKRLIARYPDRLQLALTSADVERAMKAGKIASLLGMEGGHSIDGSLGVLRQMYALGARYMTLAHFKDNAWADSATDDPQHDGLTDFGKDVVREMQRIGMLVDLAHVSEATMMDALGVAGAPVIVSHSGARAVDGHSRNVPDAVLERIKANGGIVMVVAFPSYVSEPLRLWSADDAADPALTLRVTEASDGGRADEHQPDVASPVGGDGEARARVELVASGVDTHGDDLAKCRARARGRAPETRLTGIPSVVVEVFGRVVIESGEPGREPLHRCLELRVEVDEGAELVSRIIIAEKNLDDLGQRARKPGRGGRNHHRLGPKLKQQIGLLVGEVVPFVVDDEQRSLATIGRLAAD